MRTRFWVLMLPVCVTASFAADRTLTVVAAPAKAGTVSGGGTYARDARLQISATPNPGYYFVRFSGALKGAPNPQILFLSENSTVTAHFARVAKSPLLLASTG